MNLSIYAASDVGVSRGNNEDNYFISELAIREPGDLKSSFSCRIVEEDALFAVCDGMGGEEHGEAASEAAVEALEIQTELDLKEGAIENTQAANQAVLEVQKEYGTSHCGTTIAALSFKGPECLAYNIGDSRVYYLHEGLLRKLTEDHSLVQRLVTLGIIGEDQMDTHPDRSKLTRALGMDPGDGKLAPAMSEVLRPQAGDRFLLCSDGMYEGLSMDSIREALGSGSPEDAGKKLMKMALEGSSKDNITLVIISVVS